MKVLKLNASEASEKKITDFYYFESQDVFKKVHVPWVN